MEGYRLFQLTALRDLPFPEEMLKIVCLSAGKIESKARFVLASKRSHIGSTVNRVQVRKTVGAGRGSESTGTMRLWVYL